MKRRIDQAEEWHDRLLSPWVFLGAVAAHILLAIAMRKVSAISQLHAVLIFVGCLYAAKFGRKPENVAYLLSYIVGCEVLWRMTRGTLLYEWGKYVVISILLVTLFKVRRKDGQPLAILQLMFLLPSTLLTFISLPLPLFTDALSFNLSGPVALCLFVVYFSAHRRSLVELQKMLLVAVVPIAGIAGLTVFNVSTAPVVFNRASNYWVTGGFGPNQVSGVLGMGLYFSFILIVSGAGGRILRLFLAAVLVLLGAQSAMTFSRNGLYSAAASCLLASQFMIVDSKTRMKLLIAVPVVIVAGWVIFPYMDDFTGGALGERFQKTSTSGRDEIAGRELSVWKENIFLGVGPGMGKYVRGDVWEAAAHTEFTRLLAEHGLLGLGALLLYGAMAFTAFYDAPTKGHKGFVLSAVAWSFAFMTANAMRLTAPAFVFALACMPIYQNHRAIAQAAARRRSLRMPVRRPIPQPEAAL